MNLGTADGFWESRNVSDLGTTEGLRALLDAALRPEHRLVQTERP